MECFVDASYSPQHQIAVIGFYIDGQAIIHSEIVSIHGNAAAEKLALQRCVDYLCEHSWKLKSVIYTDHEASLKEQVPDWIELRFTPGHLKKADMTPLQLKFSMLDKAVRKMLRQEVRDRN